MTNKPILFSAPMVIAILHGRKTQTRRVVKPQRHPYGELLPADQVVSEIVAGTCAVSPPYRKGDLLWVRETFAFCKDVEGYGAPTDRFSKNFKEAKPDDLLIDADYIIYRADGETDGWCDGDGFGLYRKDGSAASLWKPSIHMPKWAARIWLEVTNVRVERVQDITGKDAMSEGIKSIPHLGFKRIRGYKDYQKNNEEGTCFVNPTDSFRSLWDSIYAKRGFGWDENPWVFVYEFEKVEAPDAESK